MSQKKIVALNLNGDEAVSALRSDLAQDGVELLSLSSDAGDFDTLRSEQPGLVLIDNSAVEGGLRLCRRIRQNPGTETLPVVLILGEDSDLDDLLEGFGVGADDCVARPFAVEELIARVRAILRRGLLESTPRNGRTVVCGNIEIDTERHEVLMNERRVDLTMTQFRLLHYLATHPGKAFSRAHLLIRLFHGVPNVTERNIDVHVSSIRKKFGRRTKIIETVHGVGYRIANRVPRGKTSLRQ